MIGGMAGLSAGHAPPPEDVPHNDGSEAMKHYEPPTDREIKEMERKHREAGKVKVSVSVGLTLDGNLLYNKSLVTTRAAADRFVRALDSERDGACCIEHDDGFWSVRRSMVGTVDVKTKPVDVDPT